MRKIQVLAASLAVSVLAFTSTLSAAEAKTYQVTGPVLEVTDTMIAVQKGKDRWEVARDGSTKITGDLKVGVVSPPDIAISFRKAREIGLRVPFTFFESASFVYDYEGRPARTTVSKFPADN